MAILPPTDAEIVTFLKAIQKHGSQVAGAAAIGLPPGNTGRWMRIAKERNLTADSPVTDPLEKARAEVKRLKAEIAAINRANDTADEIRRRIYGLREIDAEPPRWVSAPPKKHNAKEDTGTPMVLWSDWHAGEVVKSGEVGGLNAYNSSIMESRAQLLVDRTIHLIRSRGPKVIPGIIVCLGGDMITGEIHQELADTNDRYILETVRQLKSVLYGAILRMADEFGRVYVPCVVGNHGRMTLKPRMKGKVFTNYEWNIYTDLEDRFRGDRRVQFFVPGETDAYFSVSGHRFLLTHGDSLGVKGGDGIIGALGPIMRGAIKIGRSESQVGREFDTLLMGHWHQYIAMRNVIVNNCLKGYDEFAHLALRAPAAPASQALWFVHHKYGIHTQMEVYVQDPSQFQGKHGSHEKWVEVFNKE